MWHDIWLNGQRKWHSEEQAVWAADCYVKDRALTEQGAQYYTADQIHTKAHMPKAAPPKKP